jgi:hypothetical protein
MWGFPKRKAPPHGKFAAPARPSMRRAPPARSWRRSDLQCWVEVRGFEPLASSVRVSSGSPLCRRRFCRSLPTVRGEVGRSGASFKTGSCVPRLALGGCSSSLRQAAPEKIRIELVVPRPASERDRRCVLGGGQGGLVAWVVGGGGGAPVRRCACSMSWPSRSMACW